MPFKSKAQQKWMFANKPEMAKEWADKTKDFSKLPEHVAKKEGGFVNKTSHKLMADLKKWMTK